MLASIDLTKSFPRTGKVGIIANISVDPAWNGKDIDRALLFFALECISKMGATGCFAVGLNSTGVYERAGFKQWAVYQGARRCAICTYYNPIDR
jgi:N-acetylglutamate synthase-like GNAT family acetyltransferase